jgi:Zn-dependent protease with chaperone function
VASRPEEPEAHLDAGSTPASQARLLWLILEGYFYLALIVGIFCGALAFLAWGLLARRPVVGLLAVMIGFPLILTTGRAIRALCIVVPDPKGVPVSPALAGTLHAAVEDIRTRLGAPRLHRLLVTGAFNASAFQRPRFGPFWTRNTLLIGYPLLATLTPEQVRAVVAHELGHITHAHGWFAAWVHRTRASWVHLMDALDRDGTTPLYAHLLFRWYAPRLQRAAAVVSRRQELLADRLAGEVTGAQTAAQALVAIDVGGRLLDRTFWPRVFDRVRHDPEPPRPYAEMGPAIWADLDAAASLLAEALQDETAPFDTHPSLRERLATLRQPAQMPAPAALTAADQLLAGDQRQIAAALDSEWQSAVGGGWRREHQVLRNRDNRVAQLASVPAPTPEEVFERAELTKQGGDEQEALDLYRSASERGHLPARLAAGRLLLLRDDAAGVALIDAAMSADPVLVDDGCSAVIEFLERQGRFVDAHPYQVRQSRQATLTGMAAAERAEVTATDNFCAGSHPQIDIAALARTLASDRTVLRAWLAAKALRYSSGSQTVLAVRTTKGAPRRELAERLHRDCALPADVMVVVMGRHDRPLETALHSSAATVVFARSAVYR